MWKRRKVFFLIFFHKGKRNAPKAAKLFAHSENGRGDARGCVNRENRFYKTFWKPKNQSVKKAQKFGEESVRNAEKRGPYSGEIRPNIHTYRHVCVCVCWWSNALGKSRISYKNFPGGIRLQNYRTNAKRFVGDCGCRPVPTAPILCTPDVDSALALSSSSFPFSDQFCIPRTCILPLTTILDRGRNTTPLE